MRDPMRTRNRRRHACGIERVRARARARGMRAECAIDVDRITMGMVADETRTRDVVIWCTCRTRRSATIVQQQAFTALLLPAGIVNAAEIGSNK